MEYNISLWQDFNFNPAKFRERIESFEDNSTVNIFAAEEYEIKLDDGTRGWEVIDRVKNNINWNFIFGCPDVDYYRNRYQNSRKKLVHSWSTFFINRSFYYLKDQEFVAKNDVRYFFISMMNLPREHRCFLMDNIFKYNFQKVSLTWHYTNADYNWKFWKPQRLILTDESFSKVHSENQSNDKFIPSIHNLPIEFSQSLFSLVSESSVDRIFITEKTAIPLIMGQPFLVQGAAGFHKYLTDLGFELYTELFDYSFDQQLDYKKRTLAMMDNINLLRDKNWRSLYDLVYEKAVRNRNHAIALARNKKIIPKTVLFNNFANQIYRRELSTLKYKL